MFGFSAPGIIGVGFAIAILLIVIGLRERDDYLRKVRFVRAGGMLLGIMIIVTVVTVYAHLVTMGLIMKLQDVITLALVSSFGGLIIGISGYYPISQ